MKVKNLFFTVLFAGASFTSFQFLKPSDFNFHKGRTPASEQNDSTAEVKPTVTCKSESKGEKLESDVKKLIEDKEKVLDKVEGDKKEEKKEEKVVNKPVEQADLMALLSQLTTLMTAQMQMQMQMMSMISAHLNQGFQAPSVEFNQPMNSQFSFDQSFNPEAYGIGLSAQSQWHQSPYFQAPKLERQPAQSTTDFIFRNGSYPMMNGFDFGNLQEHAPMPEMKRNFMF